jgi:hypothetical protein
MMKEKLGPYFLEIIMAVVIVYLVILFAFWS